MYSPLNSYYERWESGLIKRLPNDSKPARISLRTFKVMPVEQATCGSERVNKRAEDCGRKSAWE